MFLLPRPGCPAGAGAAAAIWQLSSGFPCPLGALGRAAAAARHDAVWHHGRAPLAMGTARGSAGDGTMSCALPVPPWLMPQHRHWVLLWPTRERAAAPAAAPAAAIPCPSHSFAARPGRHREHQLTGWCWAPVPITSCPYSKWQSCDPSPERGQHWPLAPGAIPGPFPAAPGVQQTCTPRHCSGTKLLVPSAPVPWHKCSQDAFTGTTRCGSNWHGANAKIQKKTTLKQPSESHWSLGSFLAPNTRSKSGSHPGRSSSTPRNHRAHTTLNHHCFNTNSFSELSRDLKDLVKRFEELTNYKREKKQSKKSCLIQEEHSLWAAWAPSSSTAPRKRAGQPLKQGMIFSPVSIFSNPANESRMEMVKEETFTFWKQNSSWSSNTGEGFHSRQAPLEVWEEPTQSSDRAPHTRTRSLTAHWKDRTYAHMCGEHSEIRLKTVHSDFKNLPCTQAVYSPIVKILPALYPLPDTRPLLFSQSCFTFIKSPFSSASNLLPHTPSLSPQLFKHKHTVRQGTTDHLPGGKPETSFGHKSTACGVEREQFPHSSKKTKYIWKIKEKTFKEAGWRQKKEMRNSNKFYTKNVFLQLFVAAGTTTSMLIPWITVFDSTQASSAYAVMIEGSL